MRRIDFSASGHAEQTADQFYFTLNAGAHAHLRVDQFTVCLAKAGRQRDPGIRLLGGIDPQVEQCARRLQLAAGFAALGELALEALESIAASFQHQRLVTLVRLLQCLLGFDQRLPALLVLAMQTERRRTQPAHSVLMRNSLMHAAEHTATGHATTRHAASQHALQHRRGLFIPLIEAGLTAAGHLGEKTREWIASTTHRLLPRTGDVFGIRGTPGELTGDLLHHAKPLPRLRGETLDRVAGIVAARTSGQLRPTVHRSLPGIFRARGAAGRTHRFAQRTPILLGQRTDIARPTRTACTPHRIAPGHKQSS